MNEDKGRLMSATVLDPIKDRQWTPEDVSVFLGVPVPTLYQWRHRGVGPKSRRVGRHLRYKPDDVRAWFENQAWAMGYTKDLWTRPQTGPEGKTIRTRNARWGKGRRWLACWKDPDGRERSQVFKIQADADRHWRAMETDKARGEYHDSNAGKALISDFGQRWLESRIVDPSTILRYETVYRLHVVPAFGHRQVRAIKPSRIQAWIGQLSERFEPSTVIASFLALQSILDLAVADEAIKKNPAKSPVVQTPVHQAPEIQVWADEVMPVWLMPTLIPYVLCQSWPLPAECGKASYSDSGLKTSTLARRSSASGGK
jgi:predicted DNA-binding transcriptional regulator AlpA